VNRERPRTRRKPPQGTPCAYCFEEWAVVYDHLVPRSFGGGNDLGNLLPSCQLCNSLLGGNVYDSIEAKRESVQAMRRVRRDLHPSSPHPTVLPNSLPVGELGEEEPEDPRKAWRR